MKRRTVLPPLLCCSPTCEQLAERSQIRARWLYIGARQQEQLRIAFCTFFLKPTFLLDFSVLMVVTPN